MSGLAACFEDLTGKVSTVQGIQALDPNDNYCPKQPIFQNTAQCDGETPAKGDRSIVMQKLRWEPTPTIRKKAQN